MRLYVFVDDPELMNVFEGHAHLLRGFIDHVQSELLLELRFLSVCVFKHTLKKVSEIDEFSGHV